MYARKDFLPADPGESEPFGFDFENRLDDGETISSATWTCSVAADSEATDDDPQSHIIGDPTNSGTITKQRVGNLVAGVKYVLQAQIITSESNDKSGWSHVPCIEPS